MFITKPNRVRSQITGRDSVRNKASGDEHDLPIQEPDIDTDTPHRIDRMDLQKTSGEIEDMPPEGS